MARKKKEEQFRQESLDNLNNPKDLNEYIKVVKPSWIAMVIAIVLIFIGVSIWLYFGHLDRAYMSLTTVKDGKGYTYIDSAYIDYLTSDKMFVRIKDKDYLITNISDSPVMVGKEFTDYEVHVGDFIDGQWVYKITATGIDELPTGVYPSMVVTQSVNPIQHIFG